MAWNIVSTWLMCFNFAHILYFIWSAFYEGFPKLLAGEFRFTINFIDSSGNLFDVCAMQRAIRRVPLHLTSAFAISLEMKR